jgi:hypothetical protein
MEDSDKPKETSIQEREVERDHAVMSATYAKDQDLLRLEQEKIESGEQAEVDRTRRVGLAQPNNEALALKQLKSIKVALWTLVTVFVILPVIGAIGTGVVIGFMALTAEPPPPPSDWDDTEERGYHNNTPVDAIPRDWGVRASDSEAATEEADE